MSNSPFLLVPSNHQNPKLSISWTSPALKITVTCENTRQRNLKKWSSKSRMQVVPWPFVNGDLTTKPITYFYKGNCPPSGGLVDPRLNSSPLLLEAALFHDSRYESPNYLGHHGPYVLLFQFSFQWQKQCQNGQKVKHQWSQSQLPFISHIGVILNLSSTFLFISGIECR